MRRILIAGITLIWLCIASGLHAANITGFSTTDFLHEQQRQWVTPTGVRIFVNAAADFDPTKPTQLVLYALPNGNTIQWTMGARLLPGMDWRFDFQHVGAQIRKLRAIDPSENIVLACLEAPKRSFPAWRAAHKDNAALARRIVDAINKSVPGTNHHIALVAHSGGGGFIFSYLNGGDTIASNITRIAWIDATYDYSNAKHHGDKLLAWLKGNADRHLVVIAYNDSVVRINGNPIVSPTGGTWYRSHMMIQRFEKDVKLVHTQHGPIEQVDGMNDRILFLLHSNPDKKVLHTMLVGRNGVLEAMTFGTALHDKWDGTFWGPRAYTAFIAPAPVEVMSTSRPSSTQPTSDATKSIPPRPANAIGGRAFALSIADLAPKARDAAIVREILSGNIPDFERQFCTIHVNGKHHCTYEAVPDYLAIGSNNDYVRMPMTPMSATTISGAFGCTLPTREMVDQIYAKAAIKIEPQPLTVDRTSVHTFIQHNDIIQQQLKGKSLGLLVAGDKKDVVITNRLNGHPDKVAIYGWHKLDGKPIQPLYVGHAAWYRDYSHGIRLIKNQCTLDGRPATIQQILHDPKLCGLLSDEGTITAGYGK